MAGGCEPGKLIAGGAVDFSAGMFFSLLPVEMDEVYVRFFAYWICWGYLCSGLVYHVSV